MKDNIGIVQQHVQSSIRTGRYVGNYEIVRKIGEGAFSSVYLAVHVMTQHEVVLKSAEKHQTNLASEIANMGLLSHPHIVRLYEYIVLPEKVWLVLEYCGGEELLSFLVKNKVINPVQSCRLFAQLAGAVAYAHELNCAHRDLKLENVLLDEHGNVKLGDFGFTRSYVPRSMLETVCGTESYMAPELLLRKKYYPESADVWSLGVILYAMIYGRLPFDEDNAPQTIHKIVEADPEFPEIDGGEHLVELTRRMLHKSPHQRPKVMEILDVLADPGKHQKQLIRNMIAHPELSHIFSSKEEKAVLKGMKALNINLHAVASSIVHHKCDPLHGLWYTALDRQRSLSGGQADESVQRRRSKASIHSTRSFASYKLGRSQPSQQSSPISRAPANGHASLLKEGLGDGNSIAPATSMKEGNLATPFRASQQHAHAPKPMESLFSSNITKQGFVEEKTMGKSRRAMEKLIAAFKFRRSGQSETLLAYYKPTLDNTPSVTRPGLPSSSENLGLGLNGATGSTDNSFGPENHANGVGGDGVPTELTSEQTPPSSRRPSMLSLSSLTPSAQIDTPIRKIAPISDQGQPTSSASSFVSHSPVTSQLPQLVSTMSRPMSTYSQISQLSQLSQSSVEASQLLADVHDSPKGGVSPKLSNSSQRWKSYANAGVSKKVAAAAATTAPSNLTMRQRVHMFSLKERMPQKIEEDEGEV